MTLSLFCPLRRASASRDRDRVWQVVKDYDEQISFSLDWADRLASGETIASVVRETSGPTIVSSSSTATTTTDTVKDGGGEVTIRATTSASQVLQERVRIVCRPRTEPSDDYSA